VAEKTQTSSAGFPNSGPVVSGSSVRVRGSAQLGDVIDKSGNVGAKFVLDPFGALVFGSVFNGVVKKA